MKNLRVIENDLVPVYETSTGEKVVYGTELYECLGSKRQYTDWIKGRITECDAIENEDYQSFSQNSEKPIAGRPKREYIIKLDTAKEMAMLERNDKGKRVRRYFIRIEKKYKEHAYTVMTTCRYPVSATSMESATNAGKLLERLMKSQGIPAHVIAMAIRSIFLQAGIDLPEYIIKIPEYEQLNISTYKLSKQTNP